MVFCLLAAFVPMMRGGTTAFAASDFTIENGVLKKYNGSGGDVVIPDGVTEIYSFAFSYKSSVTSIYLPASVAKIGSAAFKGCTKLQGFTVSEDNKKFTSVNGVLYTADRKQLEAYPAAKENESYTVPSGVECIRYDAFYEASHLTGITLPGSLTEIGGYAFQECYNLTGVTIPAGVTKIGTNPFAECKKLNSIKIASGNDHFVVENGALMNVEKTRLISYAAASANTSYIMPDTVTELDWGAFYRAEKLEKLTLSKNLSSVGYSACYGCSNLTSVVIPNGVKLLSESMFAYCSNLTEVTIPSSVTKIDRVAFIATSLKTVRFLCNRPTISTRVFPESVTNVYYSGSQEDWENIPTQSVGNTIHDAFVGTGYTVTYNYCPDFSVESGVLTKYTGTDSFVIIPGNVTAIGENAFGNCSSVTNIIIPDSVTSIGNYAFYKCTSLTDITLPDSLKTIGQSAFNCCSSLTAITIPASVTSVEKWTFDNCTALTAIHVADGNSNFCAVDGVFFNKDKTKLIRYPEGKTGTGYSIPATVKTVCDSAFYHCSQLTSIEIPSSVRIIEDYGISACDSLERITFPESVNSVGEFSFANNTNLKTVTILAKSPSVESNAFDNSAVKTVHYAGSETEWNASDWKNAFSSATVDYNYGSLAITQQPKSQSIIAGKPLTLSVKATGDSLQYQWYYKKKGQTSFSVWKNRTNATETVSPDNTWDGIQLYCKITDSGNSVSSNTVTVSVLSITTQPGNVTVAAGSSATGAIGEREPPLPQPQRPMTPETACRCAASSPTARATR